MSDKADFQLICETLLLPGRMEFVRSICLVYEIGF
jgi:hypothetical protein